MRGSGRYNKKKHSQVVYVAKNQQSTAVNKFQSEEEDFKGKPESWYDEKDFLNGLPSSLFDFHKDDYFDSYSHFSIHYEMLKDKVRTGTYQKACMDNPEYFKGKTVLDIGCGTGILSIFAAKAGAKHVYSVDNAFIVDYAREIIKNNHLEDKITVIRGMIEEIQLPVDKVDIIISEWMGYCLFYESMLQSVLFARDKWLAKDGILMPGRIRMGITAITDDHKEKMFGFWNPIYSTNMKVLGETSYAEPRVEEMPKDSVISTNSYFIDTDLYKLNKDDISFANEYNVTIKQSTILDGFVIWFDVIFDGLPNPVVLSTSPFTPITHWAHTILYLRNSFKVKENDVIKGTIALTKNKTNFRDLDIVLTVNRGEGDRIKQLFKLT